MDARRAAGLAGIAAFAAALAVGLPPWPFRLEGVKLGVAIGLVALAAAAGGVWLALSMRRAWARALVSVATGLAVCWLAWVGFVFATVPDFDRERTIEWTRLPDASNATLIDANLLPAPLRADFARANVTDAGWTTVPKADADAFWAALDARVGPSRYQTEGRHGYAIDLEGRVFDVSRGPMV